MRATLVVQIRSRYASPASVWIHGGARVEAHIPCREVIVILPIDPDAAQVVGQAVGPNVDSEGDGEATVVRPRRLLVTCSGRHYTVPSLLVASAVHQVGKAEALSIKVAVIVRVALRVASDQGDVRLIAHDHAVRCQIRQPARGASPRPGRTRRQCPMCPSRSG